MKGIFDPPDSPKPNSSSGGPAAPKPKSKGISWSSIPSDYGAMYSGLAIHPLQTAKSIWHELEHFNQPVGETPQEIATSKQKIEHAKHAGLFDLGAAYEGLSHRKGWRMLPLLSLAGLTSPEGREQAKQHPGNVAMDVATLAVPFANAAAETGGTAAKVASSATEVAAGSPLKAFKDVPHLGGLATPVRSTMRAIGRSETGARIYTKLAPGIDAARSVLPSKRLTAAGQRLGTAARQIDNELRSRTGPYAEAFTELTQADRNQLRINLARGERPTNPKLATAYDAYRSRIEAMKSEKLARDIPENAKNMLRDAVDARIRDPLTRVLGPQRAEQMLEAFLNNDPNPFPEAKKAWGQMQRAWDSVYGQQLGKYRLAEHPDPRHASEALSIEQASKIKKASRALDAGLISQDDYEKLVGKIVPGRYRPALETFDRAKAALRERFRLEPGFGPSSYKKAVDAIESSLDSSWREMADAGIEPVFIHRRAAAEGERMPTEYRNRKSTGQPASLKTSKRLAEAYHDEPVAMLIEDERDMATQHIMASTIADVYQSTGGRTFSRAVEDFQKTGFTRQQALDLVRSKFRSVTLEGKIGVPKTGDLLVHRDVANAIEHYFNPKQMSSWGRRALGTWMIPVLYLAPAFHVYNILGGAIMASYQNPSLLARPDRLVRYAKDAMEALRTGTMDPRLPTSAINDPIYRRVYNPAFAEAQGAGLAAKMKTAGVNLVESSRKLNDVFDGIYRSITYTEQLRKGLTKGLTKDAAEHIALREASNVLQNWDALSPIERNVFQKFIPFWGWKRTMIRFLGRYQIDHPYRVALLHALTKPAISDQEAKSLPEDWTNLIPIGGVDKNGEQKFLSGRGLNPFSDMADLGRLRGWLSALHPGLQAPLQFLGVDTGVGGVPAFAGKQVAVDPATGRLRRPYDWGALTGIIPQGSALLQAIGATPGLPPPTDTHPSAFMQWARRYWSALRLPFPPTQKNVELVRQRYLQAQAEADASQGQASPARAGTSGGGSVKGIFG